jgi:hypothetical protein
MTDTLDTRSADYVRAVAERTAGILPGALVGTYLHGSAVLGGFDLARSDLDLLVVTTRTLHAPAKRQLAAALSPAALPCPAAGGLELSVVTRTTTLAPVPAPRFELHLATGGGVGVVDGRDHPGDPDLLLHFAVCRDHGHPLAGPRPRRVYAAIPRLWLLAGLAGELAWARHHAGFEYQVLNACRAWRFVDEGLLCSKLEGARWARTRLTDSAVVDLAIARRQGQGADAPDESAVAALIKHVLDRLHRQLARPGDQ